ncbi:unnamed protein product [Penicillium roqueforti FM164]|uniref:Genomic scaffold, ProqFM164S03 n=1 Tax=Penicillium roqueforti (strain FM164) TaxID=1365484 RepID=W6QK61_PENRF|nr:unnamed protein product [Penicillium roqueforti FM164]
MWTAISLSQHELGYLGFEIPLPFYQMAVHGLWWRLNFVELLES